MGPLLKSSKVRPSKKRSPEIDAEPKAKKRRIPPPTAEQKEAMLKYMERHTNYACGRVDGKNAAI